MLVGLLIAVAVGVVLVTVAAGAARRATSRVEEVRAVGQHLRALAAANHAIARSAGSRPPREARVPPSAHIRVLAGPDDTPA